MTRRVAVTFDNLGEASEIEQGAWPPNRPRGRYPSVVRALPRVLALLHQLPLLRLTVSGRAPRRLRRSSLAQRIARLVWDRRSTSGIRRGRDAMLAALRDPSCDAAALAAAAALARETAPGAWRYALGGLAQFEPLRRSVRHHFAWAREPARRDPAHWNPALLNDRG